MTILVPMMLFGWVPFTIFLFFQLPPHKAVLVSIIGGWLMLPTASYDLSGLPSYSKYTAISIGLIIGGGFIGRQVWNKFRLKIYDLPMFIWCFSSIPTSLENQLGIYDGLAGSFEHIMIWGIPYMAGRIYFRNYEELRDLAQAIVIGGSIYAILCLYEIRMSPQLNKAIYGFFPHSWSQHIRYGGWRPIVFMVHGLMVAVWMAVATTTAFWLWRSKINEYFRKIPFGFVVAVLSTTTVLCKTASGWVALALGCSSFFIYNKRNGKLIFILLSCLVPLYISFRVSGIVPIEDVEMWSAKIFDTQRTNSLAVRLYQEELFIKKTMESPLLGWGGYSRGWPVDPITHKKMVRDVDALWIIILSTKGYLGLISWVIAMMIGPWLILQGISKAKNIYFVRSELLTVLLSMIVIIFMIDSIVNAMVNPVYIMCTGVLVCWHILKTNRKSQSTIRSIILLRLLRKAF